MTTLSERTQKRLEKFLTKKEEENKKKKVKKKKQKRKKENKTLLLDRNKKIKKKKVGRPKKRGPKKKRIRRKNVKTLKKRPVVDFKIISSLNGKQNEYIGCYQTYSDAINKLNELENENNKIIFPRKYINSETVYMLKDEYLLLEKNREGDKNNGMLRNDYGKFIEHEISNNDKWIIRDKIKRYVEETFWVYGFDPKKDRKTFTWIYDYLLLGSIENSYDVIRIMVYKNKLLIKYDNKPMSIIMCKNMNDSIRMYNLIYDKINKNKIKQIICIGTFNKVSDSRRLIEKEIMELTGWNKIKVQRPTN